MRKKKQQFNVQELFDSLSPKEQNRINCSIVENTRSREEARYARLQAAEIAKNELIQELDQIEYDIDDNDNWFIAAKERKVDVTPDALNLHRKTAEDLYSRKTPMIDRLLPEAESNIKAVISQIETEEAQEPSFQTRDLGLLLLPFYEERERERRQAFVAEVKERIRQREEEEAKRQEECWALLERLRTEELEKSRLLAEERRKRRAEKICARVHARQIPYLVHFTPISTWDPYSGMAFDPGMPSTATIMYLQTNIVLMGG